MSRIGRKPLVIPSDVQLSIKDDAIMVKGPKGQLSTAKHPLISVEEKDGTLVFDRNSNHKDARAAHGLMRALCSNLVEGVTKGFERRLEINGVGYRAETKGKALVLQLGFSHPIEYTLPEGVAAKVEKNQIILTGINKEKLGLAAAKIRSFRPPEPYKGKGVKYIEEHIVRKAGKAAG